MSFNFRMAAFATLFVCLAPLVCAATPEVAFEKYRLPNGRLSPEAGANCTEVKVPN